MPRGITTVVRRRWRRHHLRPARQRQPLRRRRGGPPLRRRSATIALRGGPGDDLLSGGFGADSLDGEAGDDFARGDATIDRIGDCGGGTDTLSFATGATPGFPNEGSFFDYAGFPPDAAAGASTSTSASDFANDGLAPSGGGVDEPLAPDDFGNFETVIGTPFDDYIVGTADAETFYGGGGADLIEGGGGADVAYGGAEGDGCVTVPTSHECESRHRRSRPAGSRHRLRRA